MKSKVKLAVVGCGYRGSKHVRVAHQCPQLDIALAVDAWGCKHALPHVEDVVYSRLNFENGSTAHIHVSRLDPVKVRDFTVVGSEGMLVFNDFEPVEKVKIFDKHFKPIVREDSFAEFQASYHDGEVFLPEIPSGEPLQLEVLDFANSIRTGVQPRTHGRRGLRVVEALEVISQGLASIEKKDPHLPFVDQRRYEIGHSKTELVG